MIDIIIIAIYLIFTLFVGLYNKNKGTTLSEYGTLGSDLNSNLFVLTATIFASAVGGGATFGIAEKAYSGNLGYSYALILSVPIDLIIATYLVPKLSVYKNVTTIGEIVRRHYGSTPQIITGLAAALISIGYLSAQISVSGIIFSSILKIDYIYGIAVSYAITIAYTSFGGFRSIVINNTIQFVAMLVAIPGLSIYGVYYLQHSQSLYVIDSNPLVLANDDVSNFIYAFMSFAFMGFYPTLIQRIIAGKNTRLVKRAIYIKTLIYILFIVCISLNGLLASIIVPSIEPRFALSSLIDTIIPEGLKGVIAIGLLASVMSTADSDLNVASISIVNDVLKPIGVGRATILNNNNMIYFTKMLSVLIGSIAIFAVMQFKEIVDIVIFAAGVWAPVAVVPIIGILYGIILSDRGFCITAIAGSSGFIIAENLSSIIRISSVFTGVCCATITFIIIWRTGWASQTNQKN